MNLFLTNTLFKTFLKRDSAKVTHHKGEALTFVVTAVSASEALRERERERESGSKSCDREEGRVHHQNTFSDV